MADSKKQKAIKRYRQALSVPGGGTEATQVLEDAETALAEAEVDVKALKKTMDEGGEHEGISFPAPSKSPKLPSANGSEREITKNWMDGSSPPSLPSVGPTISNAIEQGLGDVVKEDGAGKPTPKATRNGDWRDGIKEVAKLAKDLAGGNKPAAAPAAPAGAPQEPKAPIKLPRYSRGDAQEDAAIAKGKWRPNKTYARSRNQGALPSEVPPHLQGKVDINWDDSKSSGAKLTPETEWRRQFEQGNSFDERVAKTVPATEEYAGNPAFKTKHGITQQRVDKFDPSGTIIGHNYVQIPKLGDSGMAKHFGDGWNAREGETRDSVRQRRADLMRNFVKPEFKPAVTPTDTDKELNAAYGPSTTGSEGSSPLPSNLPLNAFKSVSGKYGSGFATKGVATAGANSDVVTSSGDPSLKNPPLPQPSVFTEANRGEQAAPGVVPPVPDWLKAKIPRV